LGWAFFAPEVLVFLCQQKNKSFVKIKGILAIKGNQRFTSHKQKYKNIRDKIRLSISAKSTFHKV